MDALSLFDLTRNELRRLLSSQFPANFDLENTLTAYAYWVCTVVRTRGKDWGMTVQEYVGLAVRDALLESQAAQIELEVLRRELRQTASPLLDVGAGWGRIAPLYAELGLQCVFVEPSSLGCQLLRRNGIIRSVRGLGQHLSFPERTFPSVIIGWVLYHDAPDVPSDAILKEIARVITPGGRLLSIEPLSIDFDAQKWLAWIESAGFEIEKLENYFEMFPPGTKSEQYACLTAVRRLEQSFPVLIP